MISLILTVLSLLFLQINPFFLPYVNAVDESTYYARVMFDSVYLYRTPVDDSSTKNLYFELPKTYFVELLDSCNNLFYKAKYSSLEGYVKKECVQAISGTPTTPYLDNLSFRVYAELSRDMRSEPNTNSGSSKQVAYIPNLSRNLIFLGKMNGERLIEGRTNVWYFCKYSADTNYYGYVYSDFCDELISPLPINTEEVSYISNPTFEPVLEKPESIPINNKVVPIIVGILCIPATIFVLMVMKGKNILTKEQSSKGEIKDY